MRGRCFDSLPRPFDPQPKPNILRRVKHHPHAHTLSLSDSISFTRPPPPPHQRQTQINTTTTNTHHAERRRAPPAPQTTLSAPQDRSTESQAKEWVTFIPSSSSVPPSRPLVVVVGVSRQASHSVSLLGGPQDGTQRGVLKGAEGQFRCGCVSTQEMQRDQRL